MGLNATSENETWRCAIDELAHGASRVFGLIQDEAAFYQDKEIDEIFAQIPDTSLSIQERPIFIVYRGNERIHQFSAREDAEKYVEKLKALEDILTL